MQANARIQKVVKDNYRWIGECLDKGEGESEDKGEGVSAVAIQCCAELRREKCEELTDVNKKMTCMNNIMI